MAILSDPFDALLQLQQALDTYRTSSWLGSGLSSGGAYPLTVTADNEVNPNATQDFTLTVNQAPAITSADATTFVAGSAGRFLKVGDDEDSSKQ